MKVILIIFIVLIALAAVLIFVIVPRIKRKKLAQAWADLVKIDGKPLLPSLQKNIEEGLKKVSNSEVDRLIEWSRAMQAKDFVKAGVMTLEIGPILSKTGLDKTIFAG